MKIHKILSNFPTDSVTNFKKQFRTGERMAEE